MSQKDDQMERFKDAVRRCDLWLLLRLTREEWDGLKKALAKNPARYLVEGIFVAIALSILNSLLTGPFVIDVLALAAILWGGIRSIFAIL